MEANKKRYHTKNNVKNFGRFHLDRSLTSENQ